MSIVNMPAYRGYYDPTEDLSKIVYGEDALASLPNEVSRFGQRALLVTGNTIHTKTDLVQRVRGLLGDRLVGVFADTVQHTPRRAVLAASDMARDLKPDIILSLGGGSATDTAKAMRLALWADITDDAGFDRAFKRMKEDPTWWQSSSPAMLPQVGMPTTLISGEHTQGMGITNEVTHGKQVFSHPQLLTSTIILDPALSVYTPPQLWFSTGIKALEHAIAKLSALERDPVVDAIATQAVQVLSYELRHSYREPDNLTARGNLLVGAWLCMFGSWSSLVKRMGLSHALGRQTGGVSGASHGMISSVLLPRCIEFNAPVSGLGLTMAAAAMGVDTSGMTGEQAGLAAAEAIRALVAELGLPARLRDIGVMQEQLPVIADRTMSDMSIGANPRPVSGANEVLELLQAAW
ncbi:MAG: iron-containing alcohol dehydrogenase [Anaerolineae bacterium]|nr:iron-containing alcohol dehydrogenase [Anaerolineae bacterium]